MIDKRVGYDPIIMDVPGYEGLLQISENGEIFNKKTGHQYVCDNTYDGYLRIRVYIDGKRKQLLQHRLLAQTFIDNPENKPFVDHIDRNKTNNTLSNLRWCTPGENLGNMSPQIKSETGVVGVHIKTKDYGLKRYCAALTIGGVSVGSKVFEYTPEGLEKAKEHRKYLEDTYQKDFSNKSITVKPVNNALKAPNTTKEKYIHLEQNRYYRFRHVKTGHSKNFKTLEEAIEYRDNYLNQEKKG